MSVTPADIGYYTSALDPAYDGSTTLSAAISSTTATTISITNPATFPPSGEFGIQVDTGGSLEYMWVTQGAGTTTFTVIRGILGSAAATHLNGATVTMPAGGPPNFLGKVGFSDIVSGDTADYFSTSSSDNLVVITLKGRDTTGVIQTETKSLNGTTIINGSQTWDRLLSASLGAVTTSTGAITNSGTTLTVANGAALPSSGNYNIMMAQEAMTVTAGQGTTSLTVTRGVLGTTATAHNSGDSIYLMPVGDIGIVDHTKVISSHTMQAGSANASGQSPPLAKLQAGDGAATSIGQIISITSGTGSGQVRSIIATSGYGTDLVAVSRNWSVVPDNTSVYQVYNGMQFDILPNPIAKVRRFLWNATADIPGGSTRMYYEKVFAANNNTTVALIGATVQDTGNSPVLGGSAALDLATATSADDNVIWATRQTAPGSGYGAFVVQPGAASYGANSGALAPGAAPNIANAQGIVLRLTLPAATPSYKGSANLRTLGNTM